MTVVVPDVAEVTVDSAWGASDLMAGIYTHFNSVSTKWTVDAENGTSPGEDGILLSPVSGSYSFQINLRRTSTTVIQLSIEPTGSLTDPGDTGTAVTGDSAQWSDETDFNFSDAASLGAGSRAWIIETDEHISLLVTDTADEYFSLGFQMGEIVVPHSANLPDDGIDGLAIFKGKPDFYAGSTNDWFQSTASGSLIKISDSAWASTLLFEAPTASTVDENATYGAQPPVPFYIGASTGGATYPIGLTKYVRTHHTSYTSKVRRESGASDQAWLHVYDSASISTGSVIIWKKGVVP